MTPMTARGLTNSLAIPIEAIYFLYSPRINPLSSIFLANDGSMSRLGSVCFACGYWSESISSALFITGNDGNGTSSNSFLVY